MICVTSFHRDHYEVYARRFLESWKAYWPASSKLLVYQQDFDYKDPDKRLEIINFDSRVTEFFNFRDQTTRLIDSSVERKEKNRFVKGLRWSYKIYSLCNAMQYHQEPIIWLDADTETIRHIPEDWDLQLLNSHDCAVHWEPQEKHSMIAGEDFVHWETGLFVVAGSQSQRTQMADSVRHLYDSGEIWNRPFIWDGYAWADACKDVMTCFDLWESKPGRRPFGSKHVKHYMKHHSGNRKFKSQNLDPVSGRLQGEIK